MLLVVLRLLLRVEPSTLKMLPELFSVIPLTPVNETDATLPVILPTN